MLTNQMNCSGIINTAGSPFCKLRSVNLSSVRWLPGFWGERFEQCRDITLPHLWKRMADPEMGHALTNFRIAAGLEQGEHKGTNWQDEWLYKWIEAAAYIYDVTKDAELDQKMDELIELIGKVQEPDGYIATKNMVNGWGRFLDPQHHELYLMGHLITAACIHYRVTEKDNFLKIAIKVGDFFYNTFMDKNPALANIQNNMSNLMGCVELYRTTRQKKYLDVANVFIDMLGSKPGGTDLRQSRIPFRKETQVVGHAVFYTYLYSGVADVYMETGEQELLTVLDRLWNDLVQKRMYVTGGVCAIHRGYSIRNGLPRDSIHEAAGDDYELPNSTAYNETCSQIGNFMWNWRMLCINGEAKHADIMELNLYNSILPGIGLDGASWFYSNLLRFYGQEHVLHTQDAYERFQPHFKHTCCPTNMVRTFASLHGYFYNVSEEGLWVNLYGANSFDGKLADGSRLKLSQNTDYPWDGTVKFVLEEVPNTRFAIMLRIPEWAQGAVITVNGKPINKPVMPSTYVKVEYPWAIGDVIELYLPMEVRFIEGNPHIESTRNHITVKRGPIVYCLESTDLPQDIKLSEVYIPRNKKLYPRYDENLLKGVVVLEGKACYKKEGDWTGLLYREVTDTQPQPFNIRLIPYYAWNNRGTPEMTVWLPVI